MTQPLGRAVVVAERIAQGDLTSKVEVRIHDETGRLLEAIAAMQAQLRDMVAEIGDTARSIQLASAEVASGNLDLSFRTEDAARNLQEVSATLGDLTTAVGHSTDSARQANQLALAAAELAHRGGVSVTQVIGTMVEIGQRSDKIADILSVIDGISFQTNILALNAAVEAAGAGEHGKGFAVVAAEVRSLAGRVATAARDIKVLIAASADSMKAGTQQVDSAGQTIEHLIKAVRQVADIVGEITASANEQNEQIGLVSQSVGALDEVTQQNSALVEEGAASAESLKEQAMHLTQMVASFRLDRH